MTDTVPKIAGLTFRNSNSPPPEQPTLTSSLSSGTFVNDDDDLNMDLACFNLTDRDQRSIFSHRIVELGQNAGPATLRRELLPMVIQLTVYDDAAIMAAQAIPDLVACGGGLKHFTAFVPLLETVLTNVDPAVTAEGVDSLRLIVDRGCDNDTSMEVITNVFVPLILRLASSKWYSARTAAAQLLVDAYRVTTEATVQEEIKNVFSDICSDSIDAVKRAAASSLARWASAIPLHEFSVFIFPFIESFAAEQYLDGIRIETVKQLVDICKVVPQKEAESKLLPLVTQLTADRSWRVRFVVAKHIGSLVTTFAKQSTELVPYVVSLAQDEEVEVRSVTAAQLELVCSAFPAGTVEEHFVDVAVSLAGDDNSTVKSSIAMTIGHISQCCTRTVAESKLLPAMVTLLHDTSERVRCNLLEHMPSLTTMLESRSIFELLMAELVQSIGSPRWRVREGVAIALRQLLLHHTASKFNETFIPSLDKLLQDDVSAVRNATVGTIAIVSSHYGSTWSLNMLVSLHKFSSASAYSKRVLYLKCMEGLFPRIEKSNLTTEASENLKSMLEKLVVDPVSNVRRTLAKALATLKLSKTGALLEEREAALSALKNDTDSEVAQATEVPQTEAPF